VTLYTFKLLGKQGDWYALRAPTWNTENRGPMGALYFENQIFDWLFGNANGRYHLANGNTGVYPAVPALANGSSLCLLFETASDLLKFAEVFTVRDMEKLTDL
jgi:hypothetical protein